MQYYNIYYSITVTLHYTVLQYYRMSVLQYYSIAVPQYSSIFRLLGAIGCARGAVTDTR